MLICYQTGTSDSQGRDYEHALAMANILKDKVKSIDVFLLLFNGGNSRFQASIIKLLKLLDKLNPDTIYQQIKNLWHVCLAKE